MLIWEWQKTSPTPKRSKPPTSSASQVYLVGGAGLVRDHAACLQSGFPATRNSADAAEFWGPSHFGGGNDVGGSINGSTIADIAGWFTLENPLDIDDLRVTPF
jgi:hypothetical protein